MPKSKRNKQVSLTKTKKQGRAGKEALVQTIHDTLEKYDHVYVFSFDNMRTAALKDLRSTLKEDRLIIGKQTVMQIAVGRSPEEEPQENLHKVSQHLSGSSGLLFSSKPKQDIIDFFASYQESDFVTSGETAEEDVVIPAGPIPFQHTMVNQLRKLGMPVMLKNAVVVCEQSHTVCTKGAVISPEQAKILKLFGKRLGEFKPSLKCVWHDGSYEELV